MSNKLALQVATLVVDVESFMIIVATHVDDLIRALEKEEEEDSLRHSVVWQLLGWTGKLQIPESKAMAAVEEHLD